MNNFSLVGDNGALTADHPKKNMARIATAMNQCNALAITPQSRSLLRIISANFFDKSLYFETDFYFVTDVFEMRSHTKIRAPEQSVA